MTRPVLRRRVRRVVTRLAAVACPPDPGGDELMSRVVDDFARGLASLPPVARRGIGPLLCLFDEITRLRPGAGGRRFSRLDDARADARLSRVLRGNGPSSTVIRLVKGLVVLAYYEQPEVRAALGYDPDGYIVEVAARRLTLHGAELNR
jgi:hypothetical protein